MNYIPAEIVHIERGAVWTRITTNNGKIDSDEILSYEDYPVYGKLMGEEYTSEQNRHGERNHTFCLITYKSGVTQVVRSTPLNS